MSGSCFIKNGKLCHLSKSRGWANVATGNDDCRTIYLYTCNDINHAYLDLFQSVCFFFQSFNDISSMVSHKYGECGLLFAIIFSKSILQLYCHYALLCRFGVSGSS